MCDHRTSPPVRVSLMLTFSSIPLAPRPCVSAAGLSDGSEFGCTASETCVKGTINELCGVRSILKAMLFEERKRKVSFHHCLRGTLPGVESAHWTQRPQSWNVTRWPGVFLVLAKPSVSWGFCSLAEKHGLLYVLLFSAGFLGGGGGVWEYVGAKLVANNK